MNRIHNTFSEVSLCSFGLHFCFDIPPKVTRNLKKEYLPRRASDETDPPAAAERSGGFSSPHDRGVYVPAARGE